MPIKQKTTLFLEAGIAQAGNKFGPHSNNNSLHAPYVFFFYKWIAVVYSYADMDGIGSQAGLVAW